jgi:hypothetical protein
MRYWHMGSSRKARATVAMTAVHMANSIWNGRKHEMRVGWLCAMEWF